MRKCRGVALRLVVASAGAEDVAGVVAGGVVSVMCRTLEGVS
jgi:hypothetical protein